MFYLHRPYTYDSRLIYWHEKLPCDMKEIWRICVNRSDEPLRTPYQIVKSKSLEKTCDSNFGHIGSLVWSQWRHNECDVSHKELVTRKMFPFDDVIMHRDPKGSYYANKQATFALYDAVMTCIAVQKTPFVFDWAVTLFYETSGDFLGTISNVWHQIYNVDIKS